MPFVATQPGGSIGFIPNLIYTPIQVTCRYHGIKKDFIKQKWLPVHDYASGI